MVIGDCSIVEVQEHPVWSVCGWMINFDNIQVSGQCRAAQETENKVYFNMYNSGFQCVVNCMHSVHIPVPFFQAVDDKADTFEEELRWCVEQLELGLETQNPSSKQGKFWSSDVTRFRLCGVYILKHQEENVWIT